MKFELIEIDPYEICGFLEHCRSSGQLVKALCNFEDIKMEKILLRFDPLAICQLF